jgi:hypothetical protein
MIKFGKVFRNQLKILYLNYYKMTQKNVYLLKMPLNIPGFKLIEVIGNLEQVLAW